MSVKSTKSCCVSCGHGITILKCEDCWRRSFNAESQTQPKETVKRQQGLIQQVDDWEFKALNQIRQTADEARQLIRKHTTGRMAEIEEKLFNLSSQIRECRQEDNFVPQNASQWQAELVQLSRQLTAPSAITVREVSSPLLTKIVVDTSVHIPNIHVNAKWIQNGTTAAGGNGAASGLNQLYSPYGFCVDDEQTVYVADYQNHRVVQWKSGATTGQVVAGGNGSGNQPKQLSSPTAVIIDKEGDSLIISDWSNSRIVRWPRRNGTSGEATISDVQSYGLTMDSSGYLYVSDYNKHEVKRWKIGEKNGTVVAGGNGQGNRLDQLSNPMHIFIDRDHSVYVSDGSNHRVVKWMEGAKEGIVVAGGQGSGSGQTQLSNPRGVAVDQMGTVYVAEYSNHRVTRWTKVATQGTVVVGGNGAGAQPNQLNSCSDLSFDGQGTLFVCDYANDRVQRFTVDPNSMQ